MNDSNIKVLFIGTGTETPSYNEFLIKGTVSHDLLPNYLNCADIFVLPTSNEGAVMLLLKQWLVGYQLYPQIYLLIMIY